MLFSRLCLLTTAILLSQIVGIPPGEDTKKIMPTSTSTLIPSIQLQAVLARHKQAKTETSAANDAVQEAILNFQRKSEAMIRLELDAIEILCEEPGSTLYQKTPPQERLGLLETSKPEFVSSGGLKVPAGRNWVMTSIIRTPDFEAYNQSIPQSSTIMLPLAKFDQPRKLFDAITTNELSVKHEYVGMVIIRGYTTGLAVYAKRWDQGKSVKLLLPLPASHERSIVRILSENKDWAQFIELDRVADTSVCAPIFIPD